MFIAILKSKRDELIYKLKITSSEETEVLIKRIELLEKKMQKIQKLNKIISNSKNKVGIIFGPEKSGLENEHLSICDYSLKINSNPKFF